jgi:hypothetical protein
MERLPGSRVNLLAWSKPGASVIVLLGLPPSSVVRLLSDRPGFHGYSEAWVCTPQLHLALMAGGDLELDRRDVPDRRVQPPVVEPGDPLERLKFHLLDRLPGLGPLDQLGLVEPDLRLGKCVCRSCRLETEVTAPTSPRRSV